MRKRRSSTSSTPSARAIACSEPVPSSVAAPLRLRSGAGPEPPTSRRSRPAKLEIASLHGPSTTRASTVMPQKSAPTKPSNPTSWESVVPSGNSSVNEPASRSWRGTICCRPPSPLLFTSRSFSSTRKNSRSPVIPASVSSHSSSCRTARPLTGQCEIQATRKLMRITLAAAGPVPARRERGRVEALGGGERAIGALGRVAAEDPAQDPLAREPEEVKLVVGRTELAFRMEIEIERHLLDERWVGGLARRLLEPVCHQRGQHLDLTHSGTHRDPDRDRARRDDDPRQLDQTRPAGEGADDGDSQH